MAHRILVRLNERITFVEIMLGVVFLGLIVFSTGGGVIMRYVFNYPLTWASDLGSLSMIWLVFIGTAAIYRRNGHLAASSLPTVLPGIYGASLRVIVALVIVGCAFVMGWYGVRAAMTQHTQYITSMGLPRSFYSMPIVWAAVSLTVASLAKLFEPQGTVATSDV